MVGTGASAQPSSSSAALVRSAAVGNPRQRDVAAAVRADGHALARQVEQLVAAQQVAVARGGELGGVGREQAREALGWQG